MCYKCSSTSTTSIEQPPSSCALLTLILLLMGVCDAFYLGNYNNDTVLQPIMTRSQVNRVCAELCMSGLGGTPCGDSCIDIIPKGLPFVQSADGVNSTQTQSSVIRNGACDTLCANGLGYPLCGCKYNSSYTTDFFDVCSEYCVKFEYQLYGCQSCALFKSYAAVKNSSSSNLNFVMMDLTEPAEGTVDWKLWCSKMCSKGEGGAACYCDLLPMSLEVK